ncbi:MAG: NfeD family protein [Rhodospirillaceae bacterium]|nr:NfeD family protein [Rhodospirillaceae bacterium]MCY4237775.1 NfeD family protein [Rhodospirillaceae bacterium]MCY4312034.1 NfeD family protein [Rhodospirillaceae bacterium]
MEFWHWLAIGAGLAALEIMVPGTFLLWLGAAAGIVGLIMLALPQIDWIYQLLIFAVCAVTLIAVSIKFFRNPPAETDKPNLNERGQQFIGRQLTLDQPIVNGKGRAKMGDTMWQVCGPDYMRGTRVKVINVHGTVLEVQKI